MPKFKDFLILLLAVLPTYLLRFHLGPVPTTVLEIYILLIIGYWFIFEQGYRLDFLRTMGAYRVPFLLLLATSCFAVAVAPDPISALGTWKAFYVEPILLFFVFRSTFLAREDWTLALGALGISVISISIFAVFQRVTGLGIPVPWDIELRATSIFDFPNAVGLFVGPAVAVFVVLAVDKARALRERVFFGISAMFGVIAIVLSQTEALFIALPVAFLFSLLLSSAPKKLKLGIIGASIFLGVIAFAGSSTVREKLLLEDLSGQVRRSQWTETLALLKDHPIFGAGLQGYPAVFAKYHDPRLYEIFQYPHNILLNFWVELGFLGVITLVVFILSVLQVTYMRRTDIFSLVAFAGLATMCIHGLVDVPFFKNDLAVLTVFLLALSSTSSGSSLERRRITYDPDL
ncbi:MAG: O-antigen ligase family protein [Patescibacteria group bacterium]|jgi:O-antigen ligase